MLKGQKMQTSPDDSAMCWEYGGLRGRKSRWQLSFQPLELGAFFFFFLRTGLKTLLIISARQVFCMHHLITCSQFLLILFPPHF